MKILRWITSIWWFSLFASLFFGYMPDKFIIGCALLAAASLSIPPNR